MTEIVYLEMREGNLGQFIPVGIQFSLDYWQDYCAKVEIILVLLN